MKRYRVQALCLLLAAALALTGCAARRGGEDTGKLQVVCTLFPYYDFVRAIGGDRVEPYLLVTAGREAHSFEPTPLDVIRISQADVFICNGGESETWVDDILDAAGESIGSVVHMMDHAHVLGEEFSEGMQGGHDHDEHAHDEHDGHDHDGHEEEIEYDEHIWTSPRIAMDLCRVIADTLAQADPAHAQEYQDRLAAYLRELTDLDRAFRDTVEAGQRHLLVFGDRFPLLYFCREYGLDYRALAAARASNSTAPGSAPSFWRTMSTPARSAQISSWSAAAARKVSPAHSSSSTVTRSPGLRYMEEPSVMCSCRTVTSSPGDARSSTTRAVMILVVLAMSIRRLPLWS